MNLFTSCQKEISPVSDDDNVSGNGIDAVSSRITSGAWKFTSVRLEYSTGETDDGELEEFDSAWIIFKAARSPFIQMLL